MDQKNPMQQIFKRNYKNSKYQTKFWMDQKNPVQQIFNISKFSKGL